MLRLCRAGLRHGGGRARPRRSPKFLSSLPTPALHTSWNRIGELSAEERREVTDGDWRTAATVQLVPDGADGREGATAGPAAVGAEPIAFTSDEAAADYLRDEHADEWAERAVPTLDLAQNFFTELAAAADEEIDRELRGLQLPQPQSDEARREEELDVHRQFFADYYTQQGLLPRPAGSPAAAAEDCDDADAASVRYRFVDAMLRPARALFQVNGERVLSRLTCRDQLECDTSRVFQRTADPLIYQLQLMPTQHFGEPARLPYTAASSALAQREREASEEVVGVLASSCSMHGIESAEALSAMLADEDDNAEVEAAPAASVAREEAGELTSRMVTREPPQHTALPPRPPSIGQLHWLQRLVAADVLANVNLLSPILSLLAVHLALSGSQRPAKGAPRIIFDPFGLGQVPTQSTTYYRDIAQRASTTAAVAVDVANLPDTDADGECTVPAVDPVVVVVALPTPTAAAVGEKTPFSRRTEGEREDGDEDDLVCQSPSASVPFADKAVNTLYIQPPARRPRRGKHSLFSWPHCRQLLGRCDVVVCAARTSEDGVRPRVTLGDGENGIEETEAAVPNRFLTVCASANEHYSRLKAQLIMSLRHASVSGGWVLYATQSMNPIENEAVVCAVLTQLRTQREAGETLSVECVPVTSEAVTDVLAAAPDVLASLQSWLQCGTVGAGLRTWKALEGGPADQEAAFHRAEVREEVAAATWRSAPLEADHDACYLCVLRVHSTNPQLAAGEAPAAGSDAVQAEEKDELDLLSGTPDGGVRCLTSAAARQVWSLLQRKDGAGEPHGDGGRHYGTPWTVECAGLPVGEQTTPSESGPTAPRGGLSLSSAISGTAALADWSRQRNFPSDILRIPLSALMLTELLLLSQPQLPAGGGGALVDGPLRHRLFQLSQQEPLEDTAAAVVQAEVGALFDAIGTVASTATKRGSQYSVLLFPFVPSYLMEAAAEGGDGGTLHEAVAAELDSLFVAASLSIEPLRPSSEASRHAVHQALREKYPFHFSLRLRALSPRARECRSHEAAVAEVSVGVRDSLLYVLRRVGCPVDRLGLGDRRDISPAVADGEEMTTMPGMRSMAHLSEDDYAVEPVGEPSLLSFLSPAERQRTERQLRRTAGALRREGGLTSADDWVRAVPTALRQRWRK